MSAGIAEICCLTNSNLPQSFKSLCSKSQYILKIIGIVS